MLNKVRALYRCAKLCARAVIWFFISFAPVYAAGNIFHFDIPAIAAEEALDLLARKTGHSLFYPAGELKDITANSLKGSYTLQQALDALLKDTRINAVVTEKGVIVVSSTPESLQDKTEDTDMKKTRENLPLLAKVALILFGAVNVHGASAQAPVSDQNAEVLEEVIVTAQLREQNLQDVPVSVTAFDSEDMEDFRLFSLQDIARFTPGFTGSSFNNSNPIFAVRGANNTFSQAGASKPVGVFIDEVFIPRNSAANFDLFDLEQVAVLRGPQGTLFGRNVTGGALQITTARPSLEKPELKLKLGGGNLDYIEAAGLGSMPLSDNAAGKVSFSYKNRDGYITDRFKRP